MDEIDKLRRKVRELEQELAIRQAGSDGPRKPVLQALVDAGLPLDRLDDASKLAERAAHAEAVRQAEIAAATEEHKRWEP